MVEVISKEGVEHLRILYKKL